MREEVQNIISAFSQSAAGYLKVTAGGESLELTKKSPLAEYISSLSAKEAKTIKENKESLQSIISKHVGRYCAPDSPLEVGQVVDTNTILGAVSSMGLQYDVHSGYRGVLVDILIKDGDVVEFGKPLMVVKEAQ